MIKAGAPTHNASSEILISAGVQSSWWHVVGAADKREHRQHTKCSAADGSGFRRWVHRLGETSFCDMQGHWIHGIARIAVI